MTDSNARKDAASNTAKSSATSSSTRMLLERMNNDEFREYLPHIDLDELICTEIYMNEKWMHLIHISTKKRVIICQGCNVEVTPVQIREHLCNETHNCAMKKVSQFYHPAYTYFRGAKDLMNGKKLSKRELEQAIELANGGLPKLLQELATNNDKILQKPELEKAIKNPDFEKTLKSLVLSTTPKNPEIIYAVAHLPLPTFLALEYSVEKNVWKPILTSDNPNLNAVFHCELCNESCYRIRGVNFHFSSTSHLIRQYKTLEVRCKTYDYLSKNCVFRNNSKHSFYIQEAGKLYFKKQVDEILSKKNGEDKKESSDDTENDDVVLAALPELSGALKEKATALKRQIKEYEAQENAKDDINFVNNSGNLDNTGLVGVEYVIRIVQPSDHAITEYECILCQYLAKEPFMAEHLVSLTHRLRYFELHYPNTMTRYKDNMGHMKYPSFIRIIGLILAKLTLALEKYHGYGIVRDVSYSEYNANRSQISMEVNRLPHASDAFGPSFSNVVSMDEIRGFIKNSDLSVMNCVEHMKPERFTRPSEKNYNDCAGPLQDRKISTRCERTARSRSPRRVVTSMSSRKRSHSRSPRRSRHRDSKHESSSARGDIWKHYRHEVSKAAIAVENKYVEYRKQPESHPMYNQEWNAFWKNRKTELAAQGIDHRGYNFQPEWASFFKKRIEVFFGEALQNAQIEIRHRLKIPLDAEEDAPTDQFEKKRHRDESPLTTTQWDGPADGLDYNSRRNARLSQRTELPIVPPLVDNKPNVIHVLRLLSALEEHLGSLGSKVMELLAKALAVEKKFGGGNYIAFESKVLTPENCTLIETALEKLKGVVFAGLLDAGKEKSFHRVLQSTETMLQHADRMGYRNVQNSATEPVRSNDRVTESRNQNNLGLSNANDLQKLLSAIQSQTGQRNVDAQKTLSETLMSLLSGSRGGREQEQPPPTNMNKMINKQNVVSSSSGARMQQRPGGGGGGGIDYHQYSQQSGVKHNNHQFANNGVWRSFNNADAANANFKNNYDGFGSMNNGSTNTGRAVTQQNSGPNNGVGRIYRNEH